MDINEKEKRLVEFAKVLGVALETRKEEKDWYDKKGNLIQNPRIKSVQYIVIIKDD